MAAADDPGRMPLLYRGVRLILAAAARGLWGFRYSGLEHIPREGPVIIAANHVCWIDGPLVFLAASRRRPVSFLAKAELFRNPILAWLFGLGGNIPLERGKADVSAMRGALELLREGGCLAIFPQGTRVSDPDDKKVKPGLGFLAALSSARVVPARLVNTDRFPFGRPLEIRFGPSLRFAGSAEDREQCINFTRGVMKRVFEL